MATRNEIANDPMTSSGTLTGGSVWSQWGGDSTLEYDPGTNGGVCYPTTGGNLGAAYRASGSYTEAQYSRIVMDAARDTTSNELWVAVRTTGATTGYYARIRLNHNELYRLDSGTPTLIGEFTTTDYAWGAGDEFILEVENNGSSQPVFSLFHKPSGGSESQVGSSVTDTGTAITGGTVGFGIYTSGGYRWGNPVTLWSGGSLSNGYTGTMSSTLNGATANMSGTFAAAPKNAVFSLAATNELRDKDYVLVTQNNVPYVVYKASALTNLGTVIQTGTVNVVSGVFTIVVNSASVVIGDTVTILFDDGTNRATRTLVLT